MSDDLKDAVLAAFGDDDSKKPEEQPTPEEQPAENAAQAEGAAQAAGKPGLGRPGQGVGGRPTGGRMGGGLGSKVSATQASRAPVLSQNASATTARSTAVPAAKAPAAVSGSANVRPPVPAATPAAGAVRAAGNGSSSPLVILVLVLNVVLLVLCAGMLAKISSLGSRLVTMEAQLVQTRQAAERSSKLHAGVSYLGPNKRPQKYIMVLNYDEKGSPQFDREVFRPLEE